MDGYGAFVEGKKKCFFTTETRRTRRKDKEGTWVKQDKEMDMIYKIDKIRKERTLGKTCHRGAETQRKGKNQE